MSKELWWLAAAATMTALLWLPYSLEMIVHAGLRVALGNRESVPAPAPWAARARRAHANAVENLVVFAALLLAAQAAGVHNAITAGAAAVYFWARFIHALAYLAGIILVRTLAFVAGWIASLAIASQVLG